MGSNAVKDVEYDDKDMKRSLFRIRNRLDGTVVFKNLLKKY